MTRANSSKSSSVGLGRHCVFATCRIDARADLAYVRSLLKGVVCHLGPSFSQVDHLHREHFEKGLLAIEQRELVEIKLIQKAYSFHALLRWSKSPEQPPTR
jgi:hypothetical protein